MRLVATSDTHFPIKKDMIPDGDIFLLAGDFMYTGYPNEWYPRIESIAALPHKLKLLVGGNHDRHLELYSGPACQELKRLGITVVGNPLPYSRYVVTLPNGKTLLGLPFVTNLPNWSFNKEEQYIEDLLEVVGRADIIASHSPPRGILDGGRGNSYGIGVYRRYLKRFQPKLWICGHIHESYGEHAQDGCEFYNVSMCNYRYEQVNKPAVMDI